MKKVKSTVLLAVLSLCAVGAAPAGDSVYYQHASVTARVHSKWDERPHAIHILACPIILLARAAETVLHSPQILAETIEGDRLPVTRRGVLAPREVPPEDCIISVAD